MEPAPRLFNQSPVSTYCRKEFRKKKHTWYWSNGGDAVPTQGVKLTFFSHLHSGQVVLIPLPSFSCPYKSDTVSKMFSINYSATGMM